MCKTLNSGTFYKTLFNCSKKIILPKCFQLFQYSSCYPQCLVIVFAVSTTFLLIAAGQKRVPYYSYYLGFPRLVQVTYTTAASFMSLTPMSASQTIAKCVTLAIPRLVSLFSICTAGLKNLMRFTIDKQMKMQYIYRIINCSVALCLSFTT